MLKGVDSVLFLLDAVDGVRPLTKKFWSMVRAENLPVMIVINKLDRDRADFQMAFDGLAALGVKTVALHLPIRQGDVFAGVADVPGGKAQMFTEDGVAEAEIPDELTDNVNLLRDVTVENIAESDETLMEKYLEEGSLSLSDLHAGLRAGVLSGELTPVLVCSALENKGGKAILDAVEALLPSPLDRPALTDMANNERSVVPDGPIAYFVVKTLADPFSRQFSILRLLSGTISGDVVLRNMRSEENERLGNLWYLVGKSQTPCKDTVYPGAIVAVAKLKNTRSGDTLCDEKAPFAQPIPKLPPQLITYALAPKKKGEEDKVYTTIQRLLDEDITLKLARDEETGEILLSGMGQLHIELSVEKAKRRFKVDIVLKTPKVPYRETVRGKCQVQGRHKKQSGGRGQFGDCWIEAVS
ncbi:hypothetical protein AGMMS50248_00360 [Deltaproteobacteria bacterium]|nr:hypothetical protein AGMMS50248_00360 [Deltaproteobacteria bacterium]